MQPLASSSTGSSVRRRPVQRRSQERFERILDACAQLLDEVGYTALTTKEVARRAEVPIGTLYQFFTGVEGLLGALAERNLTHYTDRLARRMEAEQPADVTALVDLAVEEYVAMHRVTPGFGIVDFGPVGREDSGSLHLLDAELENNTAVANRLWTLFGPIISRGDENHGQVQLRVALECADAVLRLAFRVDPEGDPVLVAECKKLLKGYLSAP
ncbi:TetR family transcriptional regulator [Streptacidiphilus monticola]|jgi:AcrR family transcriptional regulator|uniref:TetR family transcriptional regulator n=1 Tax=Streptacidiphilus monticola TaxID=2161674 RepID=A0ABW1G4R7_9ACTN